MLQVGTDEVSEGNDDKEDKESTDVKKQLQTMKTKCENLQNSLTDKDKEIASLKEQVKGYISRLENVLGDSSQKHKEKIHLVESLEAVKKVNINLKDELNRKCREADSTKHSRSSEKDGGHQKSFNGKEKNNELDEEKQNTEETNRVEEVPKRIKMCMEGKRCKEPKTCKLQHKCNYRACRKGDECLYVHTDDNQSKKQDGIREKALCNRGKMCKDKASCGFTHMCRYIECINKDKCRYDHIGSLNRDEKAVEQKQNNNCTSKNNDNSNKKSSSNNNIDHSTQRKTENACRFGKQCEKIESGCPNRHKNAFINSRAKKAKT